MCPVFFHDNITAYRYSSGAQHLAQKAVLSSEIGAVATRDYQVTWSTLLRVSLDESIASLWVALRT